MTRIRQIVSLLMILAVVSMFSAPLLACEAAGHRCAMRMSHSSHPAAPVQKPKHDCCPKQGSEAPAPAKSTCHENAVVMPAECASSTQCCDMGNAPVVSVVQAEPAKKSLLAVVSDPPPDPFMLAAGQVDRSAALPLHSRPVFDLKTDLRI
jgi:hypothetical protein